MKGEWEPGRLSEQEKRACRGLWEEIFTEDSEAFLDYYDRWKIPDNACYGIFDGDRLVSMLQLNPYRMRVRGKLVESRYIIAVATSPRYRHRGMMRSLLKAALEDMRRRKMPFVFLMPASEAIYAPFDFRFFYRARTGRMDPGKETAGGKRSPFSVRLAGEADIPRAAAFSDRVLRAGSDFYAERDRDYLRTLLAELACEEGGLLMAEDSGGGLRGLVPYWGGEETEIREILCLPRDGEKVFLAAEDYFRKTGTGGGRPIPVTGASFPLAPLCQEGKKPVIMGRPVSVTDFLELFGPPREPVRLQVSDPLLEPEGETVLWGAGEELAAASLEPPEVACTAAELFSWLAGGGPAPEGMPQAQVCRAPFINEIV